MDDPNYKIKNIYSSVSPSEIALRCTILDLCQRLKRTEVLCDYYEQCRNELVSDCMRLRQERDYYLLAHRNSLQKSEVCRPPKNILSNNNNNTNSNQITGPQVDANQLRQSNTKIQPSFSFEKEIDFSKTTEPDDNYEEIAKRLIAQFREEMEEIRRASMNIPQLQSASRNQNEIITAMSSHVSKGGRTTTATNHSNDSSSTMPTMLATSATTPAKQSSQQMIASNCDDINNQSKLLSDVPGCNSGKPLPPPSSSSPVGTNPVYSGKKMPTTNNNNPNDCGFEFERVSVHDTLGDFQRGGGSGISKYSQSNHGIIKRDSTSETLDKLPSPCEGSSSSSSVYNRNQQQQGHHHNSPNQPSQPTQYHQNRHHVSNNNTQPKEITDRHNFKDVPTVIEVNSNRHNYNPVGGRYDRSGGDIVEQQQQQEQQTGPSPNTETEYYIDFCSKILKSSINDFDTLTRMLMNQNEKLRKLKGKQLRSYFKRQLDQNNETSNIPKRT